MGTMRTITGLGITLRMVTDMITRAVPLTDTPLGITHTCTIGIVSPFTAAAITAATTPIEDRGGLDLISDALAFGRLWYGDANAVANAIGYAEHYSRSHHTVIRVYDEAGNVIETHEHKGDFKEL